MDKGVALPRGARRARAAAVPRRTAARPVSGGTMRSGGSGGSRSYYGIKDSAEKPRAGGLLSEEFLTYSFKVTPCSRKYPHDWASCLCGHKGERATRRDLRTHDYLPIACQYAKQRLECPRGDACPHSHNLFEYWLHPKRYKTELCLFRASCDRPVCFFAHSLEELRNLEEGLPPAEVCWSAGAAISGKHKAQVVRSLPEPSQRQQQEQRHAAAQHAVHQRQQQRLGGPPSQRQQLEQQQQQLEPLEQQQWQRQAPPGFQQSGTLAAPSSLAPGPRPKQGQQLRQAQQRCEQAMQQEQQQEQQEQQQQQEHMLQLLLQGQHLAQQQVSLPPLQPVGGGGQLHGAFWPCTSTVQLAPIFLQHQQQHHHHPAPTSGVLSAAAAAGSSMPAGLGQWGVSAVHSPAASMPAAVAVQLPLSGLDAAAASPHIAPSLVFNHGASAGIGVVPSGAFDLARGSGATAADSGAPACWPLGRLHHEAAVAAHHDLTVGGSLGGFARTPGVGAGWAAGSTGPPCVPPPHSLGHMGHLHSGQASPLGSGFAMHMPSTAHTSQANSPMQQAAACAADAATQREGSPALMAGGLLAGSSCPMGQELSAAQPATLDGMQLAAPALQAPGSAGIDGLLATLQGMQLLPATTTAAVSSSSSPGLAPCCCG